MAAPKVKILVCTHKITRTLKTGVFQPILLGANHADEETRNYFQPYILDNTGENISDKQPNFSELTGLYWAWKNMEQIGNPDYIGIFHYRRFLNFRDKIAGFNPWEHSFFDFDNASVERFGWNDAFVQNICEDADIIVAEREMILDPADWLSPSSLEMHYKKSHYAEDFDLAVKTIKRMYPEYRQVVNEFINLRYGHYCNMFIMKKSIFEEYAKWLFSIFFDMEKQIDLTDSKYTGKNEAQARVFGYLGERLLNCYLLYKVNNEQVVIREYQRLIGYLTKKEQKTYHKKYRRPQLDPHNLTIRERTNSAVSLMRDGVKYILKRIFR